ncbi:MAG TPA: valine--tRNA ligase [Anaeromyxobacter sp.]
MQNPATTDETRTELSKGYEHKDVEARWYRFWTERGYFHGDEQDHARPPFSIVLPPPNVTGSLHLGHALTATLQDVLVRWKKMSGYNTLWLPGTDHAGIATQMVVEKELKKTEKVSRHDLGRAEFLRRVWAWKERYGSRIGEQHKALGASLDWARERFTMDEGLSRAVREVFVRLHEEGLVYREKKLINWCPDCHTALSDLEVEQKDAEQGELWSFAYPLADGSGEIVVATTRPETMLGDTAVAVHPDDERYRAVVGKQVRHPLTGRTLPIVADAILVDPKFGTGAVKVTPAHDFNDFEVGKRHGLEQITVIGPDARMTAAAGPVAGLDRFEARRKVKELLAAQGLDRGTRPHLLAIGRCQRSQTILEPLLSDQWYVRIAPLAKPAIEAVEQGKTRFIPEQWTNTYMAWMRNIHDWCISRQLWWGHQIPAWYCPDGHVTVAREAPAACATCAKTALRQDEDVLDTWFSSALWPFSTMGWPDRTETLRTFYPTSVMETGHDIIFFWVARMMMMGIHFMGEVPFRVVYLHPMVRDEKGQKMSKTKGNVIDPLVITEQYGADALRFTLAALTAQGRDIKLAKDRIVCYRAFANKLWNSSRCALMYLECFEARPGAGADGRTAADRWILARTQRAVNETVAALEAFKFNEAAGTVYHFVWHELCDWYIELAKDALYGDDPSRKRAAQGTLVHALATALRLLHPFMPFITEELWHVLRAKVKGDAWPDAILAAPYPAAGAVDEAAERGFQPLLETVDAIRNVRGEMNIPPRAPLRIDIATEDPSVKAAFDAEQGLIHRLANVDRSDIYIAHTTRPAPTSAVAVRAGFEVRIHFGHAVDLGAELARIAKEIEKIEGDLGGVERKLANPSFVQKAPPEVVEKDRARAGELREKRGKLEAHRAMLSGTLDSPGASPGRRETMENENQNPSSPTPPSQPSSTASGAMETMEKVVTTVSEVGKAIGTAVASGVEAAVERVKAASTPRRPARKKAKKKAARKAAPRRAARKAGKKKAAKKTGRKPARRAAKKRGAKKRGR